MTDSAKTIEVALERSILAAPERVFDAWLNPEIPGNPWNAAEKYVLDPRVDGLFYWARRGTAHYGRFTAIERPGRLQHTWVSPNTLGQESIVTITFRQNGAATLLTLVHSGLPDTDRGRGHEKGWGYFLDILRQQFGDGSREDYRWEAAHPSGRT